MDITTIPTSKLEKDLEESQNDIGICQMVLDLGLETYSGGSIEERIKDNRHFVDVITKELQRREGSKALKNLAENQQDMDPEIAKAIDDHFDELLSVADKPTKCPHCGESAGTYSLGEACLACHEEL